MAGTTTTTSSRSNALRTGTGNRIGFVLAILLGLGDVVSLAQPTPEGEVGPPIAVLVVGAVLGVVTLVGVALGWARGSRVGVRVAAASRVLSVLLALPAFFVSGLAPALRILTAAAVLLTILSVVLMLRESRPAGTGR